MYIDDFIWLPNIIDKFEVKHHFLQDEVEKVFFNCPLFQFIERGHRSDEDVCAAFGQAESWRYLIVFFILKPNHTALILSGRDMNKKERSYYAKKRWKW